MGHESHEQPVVDAGRAPTDVLLLASFCTLPSPSFRCILTFAGGAVTTVPCRERVSFGPGVLQRARSGAQRHVVRKPACQRGAIEQSIYCRVHHFEMIKAKPLSFLRLILEGL